MNITWGIAAKIIRETLLRGFPAIAVYWLLERPIIKKWLSEAKNFVQVQLGLSMALVVRWLAFLLSVVGSVLFYLLYVYLGYATMPVGLEAWLDVILSLSFINFGVSQLRHSTDLKEWK